MDSLDPSHEPAWRENHEKNNHDAGDHGDHGDAGDGDDHSDAGYGDDHGDAGNGDGDYHDQGSRICWKRGIGVGKMDLSRGNKRIETNSAVLFKQIHSQKISRRQSAV